ncbi:hypothetical protein [Prevotella sp. 885]|jgi:hypothetical protein|uniref:hypothetical protein n=1 Tax=Prevotella sp. 885 TaxID=2022527 RepID=UPI000BA06505|nr:hypothetical protein [Prevotella sp. 885]OZT04969.1 hypothetical protein CHL74_01915 [Prevotella sp. 885]DAI84503.1 MAG TPA: hypothetical protein [Caudoviricetes sp.]DAL21515.1 MAG TPA_asm: hypothetical protein [Caudoviricetes sp.]DAU50162.1 MAG TPA: hypothetical protein [Caudoviricetes sp.]
MKTSNAIKAMSSYPIPAATIENIIEEAGLDAEADITKEMRASDQFKKAKALTYAFLSEAPNITQGGISYTFSEDERSRFQKKSSNLLAELGEDEGSDIPCGYIGEDF